MRAERLIPVAGLVVALVGSACGGGTVLEVRAGPTIPPYHPSGTLLMEVGRFEHHLETVALPSMATSQFRIFEFNPSFGGAGVTSDGTVYALSTYFDNQFGSTSQLYAGRMGAGAAHRVGKLLDNAWAFQLRENTAVASGCYKRFRTIYVMDVAGDQTWHPTAQGCGAALSPDGSQLAWADHQTIWKMSLPDGAPQKVMDLARLPRLASVGVPRASDSLTTIEWGAPGIAVMVGQGPKFAMVVARDGKPPLVVPLGTNQPSRMVWQPKGTILAFGDYVTRSQTAEVRTLDIRTGALRQVAATDNFGDFAWSPDGKVIAVVRNDTATSFVDLQGHPLGVAAAGGDIFAWLA